MVSGFDHQARASLSFGLITMFLLSDFVACLKDGSEFGSPDIIILDDGIFGSEKVENRS